ncbi:hypothetical protein LCGC14_2284110, partial [marine sediment metagenome]
FGTDIDSMKIQDAQDLRLNKPNTTFWVPNFGGGGKYVLAYQPVNNPTPYKGECGCKACHTAYQDYLSTSR